MASGARATGQILKTINREGKIGVRSQSPGTMHVSSRNSGVKLLSCAPHLSPSASISLVFRGAHPVSVAGGKAGIWPTCWMAVAPALCPALWVRCTPARWGGVQRPHLPPSLIPTPALSGAPGCADGSTALQLFLKPSPALTWAPGWPCTQVPATLTFALILPLEPTHMLGSPTLFLPRKLRWPHPQGSDVGERGSWSVGPAHQSVHWQ